MVVFASISLSFAGCAWERDDFDLSGISKARKAREHVTRTVHAMEVAAQSILQIENLEVARVELTNSRKKSFKPSPQSTAGELAGLRAQFLTEYLKRLKLLLAEDRSVAREFFAEESAGNSRARLEIRKVIHRHFELASLGMPPGNEAILQDIETLRFKKI